MKNQLERNATVGAAERIALGSESMLRRLLYGICVAIALFGLYVKGGRYVNALRLGQGTTVPALLSLVGLLLFVALTIIYGRELLGRSPRARRGTTLPPAGNQQLSLRSQLQLISGKGPEAFSRRPVLVSLAFLLCAAIPFGLMILSKGGWDNLGSFDWFVIGLAELPIAFVVTISIFGPKSPNKPTT